MVYQRQTSISWRCAPYYQQRKHTITLWQNGLNRCTVNDIFEFANKTRKLEIAVGGILVSYDVSSDDVRPSFANVSLDETIQLLANRPFTNNWFNTTYDLYLTKTDLVDLLSVATKGQLFQFNGA